MKSKNEYLHFCLLKSVVGSQAGRTRKRKNNLWPRQSQSLMISVIDEGRSDLPRRSTKTEIAMAEHGHGNLFWMRRPARASSVAGNVVAGGTARPRWPGNTGGRRWFAGEEARWIHGWVDGSRSGGLRQGRAQRDPAGQGRE